MRFVVAGATGFLGTALRDHLAREGHEVVRLVRGDAVSPQESRWDPYRGEVDSAVIESADVVVNLAGAPIGHWPWTESYKKTLLESRVATTKTLADAIAASTSKPAFLAQNGTSGYSDHGDQVVTEESRTDAKTVLGGVTRAWREATRPAADAGARVCVMRSAPVLDKRGGALRTILPVFWLGLGGPIAGGRQYFAITTLHDWLRAVMFLATNDAAKGPYNIAGPNTTTNLEFTRELGRLVHRPTVMPVPGWPVRLLLDGFADEILTSIRVEPVRLQDEGFVFDHPTIRARLEAALHR